MADNDQIDTAGTEDQESTAAGTETSNPPERSAEQSAEQTDAEKPEETPADEAEVDEDLPDWARKKLTKANTDAARYRTELRAAQEKLQNAKSIEDFQAATNELNEKIHGLERELVAKAHGLPDAIAARLQGSTREELEADAKALKALLAPDPAPTRSVSGGLTPDPEDNADAGLTPLELAKRYTTHRFRL